MNKENNKENILNVSPEKLTSDTCKIFDEDPELKKKYEKKWDTEIECTD